MIETKQLPNGARIVTEEVPGARSAALGIWVGTGSRHEKENENGAAHFIEHMVFKGTETRSTAQLAQEMDAVGGQVNAFTTKECTCFHARVLDRHLPRAADLLCDMVFHSRFAQEDVETERGVILEEIGMCEDNPEDLCGEQLSTAVYRGSALSRPILGKRSTLENMTGESLRSYMQEHYRPSQLVVALAGSFTPHDVDNLCQRFGALEAGEAIPADRAAYTPAFILKEKAIEQNHLTLAFPGIPYGDERRYALQILSTLLGGGMSSRLWQEMRETRGLCYTVYSYAAGHAETGLFGVYTAVSPELEEEAITTLWRVVQDFAQEGVTEDELARAREQAEANLLMSLESTQSHMSALGRGELLHNHVADVGELLQGYEAVTPQAIQTLAQTLFRPEGLSLSAVGHVRQEEDYRAILAR